MKKWIIAASLLIFTAQVFACSTFLLSKNGQYVFGRNYDWVTGNGMIIVNARGVAKTSLAPADVKTISWVAAYGSTTFNQFGKEFPTGGMNEKGLVVELMWQTGTIYPPADDRAALNELQWIQYQLDNCATIEEVITTDKKIRINRTNATPLHYLIADATGQAATIEFINGKMIVHRGNQLPYPVLTNTLYEEALQQVNDKKGNQPARYNDNSIQRFATACNMVQQFQTGSKGKAPVDYAFTILNKIEIKGYTKWSIVYDITNRQVYWVTDEQPQRKQLTFGDINFSCTGASPALSLSTGNTGNVFKHFTTLAFEQNKKTLEQSARECRSQVNIPPSAIEQAAGYFKQVHCKL